MNTYYIRYISLLFFLFGFLTKGWTQADTAQKKMQRVQIIQADFIKNLTVDSLNIDRLIGSVILEHNGVIMTCDSAYVFPSGQFAAYGNAVVNSGQTRVWGDSMNYDGNTNMAQVRGKIVYLTDGSSTLRTTTIDFNTKSEIGYFENQGTLRDSTRLLECQRGYYFAKRKEFEFIGTVQSETNDYTLQSDSLKYSTLTKRFDFYQKTHIWAKDNYFYTDNGWYDSETSELFFMRNSYILSKTREIFADSIYYEDLFKTGQLYHNIQLLDTVQRSMALADFADFNMKTQDFELKKNPSVLFYEAPKDGKSDTAFMRAEVIRSVNRLRPDFDSLQQTNAFVQAKPDSIMSPSLDSINLTKTIPTDTAQLQKDSTYRQIWGIGKVKIFRTDLQAIADSLYFNTIDSIWRMHKQPQMWNGEKMQLTSDSIFMHIKNGQMYKGDLMSKAFIVMPETSSDTSRFFNQIKGKNMTAYFKNNNINVLNAVGNIETLFFSTKDQAINLTESASLDIYFEERKIRRVVYKTKVTANNLPLSTISEDKTKLTGFGWNKDIRPKNKEEILRRSIRPSERAFRETIPLPTFPITARINKLEQ